MNQTVLILDFGGQYKELIARAVRANGVYSRMMHGSVSAKEIKKIAPIGIILTGGPDSVYDTAAAGCDEQIFQLGIPVLAICYGMQLMCKVLGGEVSRGSVGEYGRAVVKPTIGEPFRALMSHRDVVSRVPDGFVVTARSKNNIAAIASEQKKLYGVQYHPETALTDGGNEIIRDFLFSVCRAKGDYRLEDYLERECQAIKQRVGDKRVLLGLSGGVDSSVCAAMLSRALPGQLICVLVDHGFMRKNECDEIEQIFSAYKLKLIRVNVKDRFLTRLTGVRDPERKRKIIGGEFARVFESEAAKQGSISYLAQGTIYPDIVESGGKSAVIKSHHNVGGLPALLGFSGVIEPLAGLFKDEVRSLGSSLGLPRELVYRQPFPGPGLAIRIIGEVTDEKLELLREADAIVREEMDRLAVRPDQYFAVLTDTRSVGVKGDARTYDRVICVRAVKTNDFMTCEYARIPHKTLAKISDRITSELPNISRVTYDITGKPPSTVEWE